MVESRKQINAYAPRECLLLTKNSLYKAEKSIKRTVFSAPKVSALKRFQCIHSIKFYSIIISSTLTVRYLYSVFWNTWSNLLKSAGLWYFGHSRFCVSKYGTSVFISPWYMHWPDVSMYNYKAKRKKQIQYDQI